MPGAEIDALAAVYLDALAEAGIALRTETATATIEDRIEAFAAGAGLDRAQAALFYDADVVRGWAREAAAQLKDEQPANPRLADGPTAVVPTRLIAATIAALVLDAPDDARVAAGLLLDYPAIYFGGLAVVRCPIAAMTRLAEATQGIDPALSERWSALADAQGTTPAG